MLFDMLMVFVVIAILCLLISIFLMEYYPMISIPVIIIGMIFSVLCTYGLWNVEYFYAVHNSTSGNVTTSLYSTDVYGDPYSYVFMLIFYIFVMFFIRAGWNLWKEALETKGQMDYRKKNR